jgi:hypothetical protein
VPGNHTRQAVKNTGTRIRVNENTLILRIHTGDMISNATRRTWLGTVMAMATAVLAAAKSRITKARVTVITDEAGATQADAIAFAKHYNLQSVELRKIPGTTKEFASLTAPELKRYAAELGQAKLKVSTLYVTTLDANTQAAGATLGAAQVLVMKPDAGPVRVDMSENRNWRAYFEKLERDNYKGDISLQTTPDKADDAMRDLMHFIGEL